MSAETKAALDEAFRAHIADICDGAYLTDYFAVSAATEVEDFGTGRTIYCFNTSEAQPPHISMGLIAYAADFGSVDDDD